MKLFATEEMICEVYRAYGSTPNFNEGYLAQLIVQDYLQQLGLTIKCTRPYSSAGDFMMNGIMYDVKSRKHNMPTFTISEYEYYDNWLPNYQKGIDTGIMMTVRDIKYDGKRMTPASFIDFTYPDDVIMLSTLIKNKSIKTSKFVNPHSKRTGVYFFDPRAK